MEQEQDLINPAEITRLYDDINAIIKDRFGLDDDGDQRIQVLLANRTRELPLHWFNIPYPYKIKDRLEVLRVLHLAHANVGIAMEQERQLITRLEYIEND